MPKKCRTNKSLWITVKNPNTLRHDFDDYTFECRLEKYQNLYEWVKPAKDEGTYLYCLIIMIYLHLILFMLCTAQPDFPQYR